MDVTFRKISKRSLFKLLAAGFFPTFFVVFTIFGIAALLGADTVKWNDVPVHGIAGFLLSWVFCFVFSLFTTVFNWLICIFGLWLFSFRRNLTLTFKEVLLNQGHRRGAE